MLRKGRIEQVGPPLELYENPTNAFVAGFIGSPKMNFLDATLAGEDTIKFANGVTARAPFAKGAVALGAPVTIGIRPEHFDRDGSPDANIAVAIDFVENLGGTSFVHGHVPTGERLIVEHRDVSALKAGGAITVGMKMSDARAFDAQGARIR